MSDSLTTADDVQRARLGELYEETLGNLNDLFCVTGALSEYPDDAAEYVARSVTLRDEIEAAIREFGAIIRSLAAIPPARAESIWTTGPDDEIVPLDIALGRAVYFETGTGVVECFVVDGELIVCNGEYPFNLNVKPSSDSEIKVTVDGWNEEPQPGETCRRCGAPAIWVHVWKPDGERVGSCNRPGDYPGRIRCEELAAS